MKRVFKILALLFNFLFIGMLALAIVSTRINPEQFVLPAYFGLMFLPLAVVNIAFAIYWAIRRKWYAVFSIVALILSYSQIHDKFPINVAKKNILAENDSLKQFTLLSYNVKLFDGYKKNKTQENLNPILNYIAERDADVLCLQEFGFHNDPCFLSEKNILDILNKKYPYSHLSYYFDQERKTAYGAATFSKFPIVKQEKLEYLTRFNRTIYSDIQIGEKTIRLFNCHLLSNRFEQEDRKVLREFFDANDEQDNITETAERIGKKFGKANQRRAYQATVVRKAIDESPYDVIVCGDFNETPVSYPYNKIKGSLTDAFTATSTGLGITYHQFPFLFRIDYILHGQGVRAHDFLVDKVEFSDHYPVSCTLQLK